MGHGGWEPGLAHLGLLSSAWESRALGRKRGSNETELRGEGASSPARDARLAGARSLRSSAVTEKQRGQRGDKAERIEAPGPAPTPPPLVSGGTQLIALKCHLLHSM